MTTYKKYTCLLIIVIVASLHSAISCVAFAFLIHMKVANFQYPNDATTAYKSSNINLYSIMKRYSRAFIGFSGSSYKATRTERKNNFKRKQKKHVTPGRE